MWGFCFYNIYTKPTIYMALQSSGRISAYDVNVEIRGYANRYSQFSFWDGERGVYRSIRYYDNRINGSKPSYLSEWWGYSGTGGGGGGSSSS